MYVRTHSSCRISIKRNSFKECWESIKFLKIRQMRAELYYADGQTHTYDIASSLFSNFCEGLKTEGRGRFGRRRAHKRDINVNCEDMGIECVDNTNLP
jgi:hypothetical protein